MKKANVISVLIAFVIVILNGIIGHFLAPSGILLTPLILTITTLIIVVNSKLVKPIYNSIMVYGCVALNDFLLKLFAGGHHDSEGQGWINMLLLIGLIPTFFILYVYIIINKYMTTASKIVGISFFLLLVALHFCFFSDLGLGRPSY